MPRRCRLFSWLGLVPVVIALAACAGGSAKPSVRADENKKHMVDLRPDMTTEQVRNLMGPPDKIVARKGQNGEAVLIYLYITYYIETYTSRGFDKNNYTPLIFVDERLSGWGWIQLDTAAKRYEFDLRTAPFLAPGP